MNPANTSSENLLKNLLPLILILIIVVAGIIITPTLIADPRSRASEPKTTITPRPTFPPMTTKPETPEIVCSDLYTPVCDPNTNTTYSNSCEAQKVGAFKTRPGQCTKQKPLSLPNTN